MKAILLCAGLGTRLAPLTRVLPKCLMPVNGRPLLEYWLRSLDAAGVTEVLVNTHHLPGPVRDWLSASPFDARVRVVHEPKLLGTGGTLLANRSFFAAEPVLLVHADNLCDAPLERFIEAHRNRSSGALMTMMSFRTDSPQSCGILELDELGLVRAFHEKTADPPGNLANAAVYIVEPEVAAFVAGLGKDEVDFSTEVIPHFLGRIQAWLNTGYHRDIGNTASLLAAQVEFPGVAEAWPGGASLSDCLVADLAAALAEAAGLPLVELDPDAAAAPAGPALFRLRHAGSLDSAMRLLQKSCANSKASILFFDVAAPGFSAREAWNRHGIRCLAARIADPAQQSEYIT